MNTATQQTQTGDLQRLGARIKKVRSESEAWPMLIFDDILTAADRWDWAARGTAYKNPNAWIRDHLGRSWNLARFKKVRDVVGRLGEHVRRTWTWEAAQWAYNNLSDEELKVAIDSYQLWARRNHDNPLSRGMLVSRVKEMRGK